MADSQKIIEAEKKEANALAARKKEEPALIFFEYDHLPPALQQISKPFHTMAHHLVNELPNNEQRHLGILKLLDSKDASVRARLAK